MKFVQEALIKAKFNLRAAGIFGTDTEAVVKAFQQQNGLMVDGVGAKTLEKLECRSIEDLMAA
ncbi:MAG: peptidoglycan-binding protein [Trichocoleus desertorum ATA4-8-CV12]|nr:peptidoglycan-binding protein [Trichocoleus desertorum ATA4-8-CV12]